MDYLNGLKSRKFQLTLGFVGLVLLNHFLNLGLTTENLTQIGLLVGGWIGVEGTLDFKGIQAQTMKDIEVIKQTGAVITSTANVPPVTDPVVISDVKKSDPTK